MHVAEACGDDENCTVHARRGVWGRGSPMTAQPSVVNNSDSQVADRLIAWLRDYSSRRINSNMIEERRCIPPHVILDFGDQGLLGLRVSESDGGLGLSYRDTVRVLEQLASIDITLATFCSTHANGVYAIDRYASPALRERLLPKLAKGREISGFALTEKCAGSNPLGIQSRAVRDGKGGWILNGSKYLVDSGSWSSVVVAFAQTGDPRGAPRLSGFAVEQGTPGFSLGLESQTTGLRGMVQNDIFFRDAKVGKDALLGHEGEGMAISQDTLSISRLLLAAKSLGGIKRCLQLIHRYASTRQIATGLLWENPVTQSRVVELVAAMSSIEALVHRMATLLDQGVRLPTEAFLACKVAATETVWKATDHLIQVLGGRGYVDTNIAPRLMRDARSFLISEGSNEALLMYLGSLPNHAGSDLDRFLTESLGASTVANRLRHVAAAVGERCGGPVLAERIGHNDASYWACSQIGELSMWAVMLAASDAVQGDEGALAREWARGKFAAAEQSMSNGRQEWALGHAALAERFIERCSQSIASPYQSMPGMDMALERDLMPESALGELAATRSETGPAPRAEKKGSTCEFVFSSSQCSSLRALATSAEVDEKIALVTALSVLFVRHSDSDSMLIAVSEGLSREIRIPLQATQLSSVGDVLSSVRAAIAGGATSIEGSRVDPDVPVVCIVLGRAASAAKESCELWVEIGEEEKGERRSYWSYSGSRLGCAPVSRMARRLGVALDSLVEDPERALRDVAILPAEERDLVVGRWNETASFFPRECTVGEVIEARCAREPARKALVCDGAELSYGELDARACRLAQRLRSEGVCRETKVGLCTDRSVDLVVGMLGIWKAGATYVPLDPISNPSQRLSHIISAAGIEVIVAHDELAKLLPVHSARLLAPHIAEENELAAPASESGHARHPDQAAYVLFTSGTSGKPKGVEVSHRALGNFLHSMAGEPGLGADDTLVAVTTISFDIAGLELLLPLTKGAQVVIARSETAMDPTALMELLEECGATILQATPATWQMLLAADWRGRPGLKALCGGEALPRELAVELRQRVESLWNMYGPTETTIWSSTEDLTEREGPISIGRPIANTQIYVLDDELRPVPIGLAGEIVIGGEGLARGYYENPALTAKSFVPDPFAKGARMYRTGDRGRFLADGRLEHLGRLDHQIKLRGFRIELGEIEAALRQHAAVSDAAVTVIHQADGDPRLAAYVLLSGACEDLFDTMQQHVREHVPSYMVPAAYVPLEEFPRTPNGKLDRKALPAPTSEHYGRREYEAPQDSTEAYLADLWAELLEVPRVGRHDDFFALGGHSLLLARAVGRVSTDLNVDVRIHEVLGVSTIAETAALVRDLQAKGAPAIERMKPRKAGQEAHATSQQFPYLFAAIRHEEDRSSFNVLDLAIVGDLDCDVLVAALKSIVDRHEILRTVYELDDVGFLLSVVQTDDDLMTVLDSIPTASWEAAEAALDVHNSSVTLDTETGPISRFILQPMSERRWLLRWIAHHAAVDAPSFAVFGRELGELYSALEGGGTPSLPPLAVQFADFAIWAEHWRDSEDCADQIEYWRRAFNPTIYATSKAERGERFFLAAELDGESYVTLGAVGRREGMAQSMLFLTLYHLAVTRALERQEAAMLIINANRQYPETFDMIGQFSDMLPVCIPSLRGRSLSEATDEVQGKVRSALKNSGICAHEIFRLNSFDLDSSAPSLFLFHFEDFEVPSIETDSIQLERYFSLHQTSDALARSDQDFAATLKISVRKGVPRIEFYGSPSVWTETTFGRFKDVFLESVARIAKSGGEAMTSDTDALVEGA